MRAELGRKLMGKLDDDMWTRLIRGGAAFAKDRVKNTADLIRRTIDWREELRVDRVCLAAPSSGNPR